LRSRSSSARGFFKRSHESLYLFRCGIFRKFRDLFSNLIAQVHILLHFALEDLDRLFLTTRLSTHTYVAHDDHHGADREQSSPTERFVQSFVCHLSLEICKHGAEDLRSENGFSRPRIMSVLVGRERL